MKTIHKTILCLAALLAAPSAVLAQSSTQGGIGGTVEDATGAVIANVTITIHNDATNAEFLAKTDASGNFVAPLLEPGVYTVSIAASGFEAYRAKSVTVQVGQITNLLPHLTTGASSTVVEVNSSAPVLNFEAPDFASNLNTRALENVPVNNLRWSSLALTTPGVVSDSNGFGLVSVRGISTILNNVLIDGADDNQAYYSEERGRTREAYSTPPEAIQEFQVNTGVYQAQYGRAAGGVINSVTKSGGNSIHGQAYFSDRESSWGAFNPYTTNTVGTQNTSTGAYTFVTSPYKPQDSRKIWGFTAGGALIKDKLFWQYTYDQHHRVFPGTAKANNPGSFFTQPAPGTAGSNVFTDPGTGGTYTCSLTTGYAAPVAPTTAAAPALDTYACTLAAREGLSSYAAGATAYGNGLGLLLTDLGSVPRTGDQVVNMPKLDYQLNSKNHVTLLYNRLRWDSPGGVQTQATNNYAVDTFGQDFVKLDYGVAKLSSLISSSMSNELLYQYGRELNDESQQPYSAFTQKYLVGTGGNVPEVALATSTGFYLGSPYYSYRKALPDERKWQIGDTLYFSKGNHSFKFGLDSVHNHDLINNTYESNGYITYSYIGNFLADLASEGKSTDTCNSAASPAGTASTSAVGNYPCYSTFVQGFGPPVFQVATFDYGLFAQDTWKVSPRLTLELGVRYDNEILPGTSANSNLTSAATLGTFTFVPYAALTNAPDDKNNIGPRVGFAYDIAGDGKTVVRGGFGMYYGRLTNGNLLNVLLNTGSPNGQFTASLKGSTFCNAASGTAAAPGVVPCASGITPGTQAPVFPNIISGGTPPKPSSYYLAPNLQNPLVQQFDLIIQRQVGRGTVASVSYLGALGKELTNFIDTNLSSASLTNTTITINNNGGKGPLPNGATYVVPQYTAYTNTNYSTITELASNINSSYNAVAVEVQNRSLKSLQFDVNYVWSHALDYNQQAGTTTSSNNQYDPNGGQAADYGNSQFNVPDRVAGYVLYNLPNAAHGGWLKYLANDWAVDTAFQAQSGLPYSAGLSGFASAGALNSSWNGAGGTSWIPIVGRNTYKYPRDVVQDVRLQKQIPFTERYKGEARLDLYNVYNHQNVTGVNSTAYALTSSGNTATALFNSGQGGTSTFGSPSNSNSEGFLYTARQVQISFKLLF